MPTYFIPSPDNELAPRKRRGNTTPRDAKFIREEMRNSKKVLRGSCAFKSILEAAISPYGSHIYEIDFPRIAKTGKRTILSEGKTVS
jgi:hypothetical protein